MIDPQRHAEDRNLVERILGVIPGFHGYLQKEYRRESDHLARSWLADELQSAKSPLDELQRRLVDEGKLNDLPPLERVRSRLDQLINEIRGAVRGYSGFFDFVRVKEETLDQVYALDMSLVEQVQQFRQSAEKAVEQANAPDAVARDLLAQLEVLDQKFSRRSDLLQGMQ